MVRGSTRRPAAEKPRFRASERLARGADQTSRRRRSTCSTNSRQLPFPRGSSKMRREYLNPPGLFQHPAYTRIVSVDGPRKTIYFAGQTATDEQNAVVGKGDYLAQYRKIMENLTVALAAAGATW